MVVRLEDSPISTEELWSSVRVTIGFLVTSLTKALLPRLLNLAGRLALGRVLMVSFKLLPFKNDGSHCVLGDLQCCRNVSVPFPRSVPRHNLVYRQFLAPYGLVFALTYIVNYGTLYGQVCLSKSCPINWIYHRWTPIKLIKDNQWKQDAPELNFESHSKGSESLCK